jgi:hypothetical protein
MALAVGVTTTVLLLAVALGAGLRRLSERHIFHDWSGWSEPIRAFPWTRPTQHRRCLECNKVARRKV